MMESTLKRMARFGPAWETRSKIVELVSQDNGTNFLINGRFDKANAFIRHFHYFGDPATILQNFSIGCNPVLEWAQKDLPLSVFCSWHHALYFEHGMSFFIGTSHPVRLVLYGEHESPLDRFDREPESYP